MADERRSVARDPEALAAQARAVLPPLAWDYFAGGAGEERTLSENQAAWGRYKLRPRVLVDVGAVSTRTTVLGTEVALPVLVAPSALQRMAHPDGEEAVASATADAGTVYVLSTAATATPEAVTRAAPDGRRWFQLDLHRDRARSHEAIATAVSLGFSAVVLTVDTPVPGVRRRDQRNAFAVPAHLSVPGIRPVSSDTTGAMGADEFYAINDPTTTWDDLAELVASCPLPVLVKGVQAGDDARLACEHGAAAVIVSNHGGRQLDGVAATADVLPEGVEAVDGRVEVLVDGGIRTASDVVVALALGARAVLIGRPILWGLAVAGQEGCRDVLAVLADELNSALALMGVSSPAELGTRHLHSRR